MVNISLVSMPKCINIHYVGLFAICKQEHTLLGATDRAAQHLAHTACLQNFNVYHVLPYLMRSNLD
jgi:hypothetical protein